MIGSNGFYSSVDGVAVNRKGLGGELLQVSESVSPQHHH